MPDTPLPTPTEGDLIEPRPYELLRSEQASVGKIITIGAELEHIISMAYFKTVNLDPLDGFALHGKATIASRIANLRLALRHRLEQAEVFEKFKQLEPEIKNFINIRNMFAHGVLMGLDADDMLNYLVTIDSRQEDAETLVMKMKRVQRVSLAGRAFNAKTILHNFRIIFDVTTLHERNVLRAAMQKSRGQ